MQHLTGGRTASSVVRVGATVQRSPGVNADFVHEVLLDLERCGFEGAPRFLGMERSGREVLTYLPGYVPSELGWFSDATLASAARLLRALHDATAESTLRGSAEVVCHGDASPCNTVFRDGMPFAFIDFDAAHAGARRDDVGYAAWLWLDVGNDEISAEVQGKRLAIFLEAYGYLEKRDGVAAVLDAQAALSARADAPAIVRHWAAQCRSWVTTHRVALERAVEEL